MAKADDKRVFDADGELFFWTFFLLSMLPFFSSVGIVCYQSFMWMKYGEWLPITIDMAVDKFFRHSSLNEWLINPQSWYGLHKMISGTSLSPCLFIFSIFSAGLVFSLPYTFFLLNVDM